MMPSLGHARTEICHQARVSPSQMRCRPRHVDRATKPLPRLARSRAIRQRPSRAAWPRARYGPETPLCPLRHLFARHATNSERRRSRRFKRGGQEAAHDKRHQPRGISSRHRRELCYGRRRALRLPGLPQRLTRDVCASQQVNERGRYQRQEQLNTSLLLVGPEEPLSLPHFSTISSCRH